MHRRPETIGAGAPPAFEPLEPRLLLSGQAVISELMAINNATLADEDGDYSDWLEIHNTSAEPIDLTGWKLRDSQAEWAFPGVPLGADEYLVVFASDKGRAVAGRELHTNFRLSGEGEHLALVDDTGAIAFEYYPSYPGQIGDVSYGVMSDLQEQYFTTPTPGQPNVAGVLGIAAEPVVSVGRGFYDEAVTVEITTATAGAELRYTLDGSAPTATTGVLYTAPLLIADTSVLRAAALKPGYYPSAVATHTYLIGVSEAIKSLPVISLVGDEYETFGTEEGLWADVLLRGMEAEFPVSFEVLRSDDGFGLQQDAGIRLHGSSYRRRVIGPNPDAKWSFKIFFRDEYGDSDWLDYDLIEASDADRYRNLTLRSGYNDSTNPFIKDELGRRLFEDMGSVSSIGTFANLYINGQLKNNGYYNPAERYDEHLFQEKLHSDLPWDVVEKWQPTGTPADPPRSHDEPYYFDVRDGDEVSFAALLDYALANDLSQAACYEQIGQWLDLPQFVDYLILEGYTRIHDWPQNNWTAARERSDGSLGKWRFCAWDLEFGWSSTDLTAEFKTPGSGDLMPLDILYSRLVVNAEFRQLFADRAQAALLNGGALTAENVVARFEELRAAMAGVLGNMNTYIRDTWAAERPGYVLASMAAKGLFTFQGPAFGINGAGQHGGRIAAGDVLTIDAPAGTIYYTLDGSDPRLPGGWISPTALAYTGPVALDGTTIVKARVLDGGVWSALTEAGYYEDIAPSLRITEVMYAPAAPTAQEIAAGFTDAEAFEYIELTNVGDEPIRLHGVRFTEGAYGTLGAAEVAPGEYVVVAANRAAFELRYGGGVRIVGTYAGSLDNGGEDVALKGPLGEAIQEFRYDDWYDVADGAGCSLTVVDTEAAASLWSQPENWKPSRLLGGTPGAGDDGPAPGAIVVSEVLAHSHAELEDWVELLNTTGADIDIGGWFLSDSGLDLAMYELPAGTIVPAGQYLVLTEGESFGAAFALSELGDDLYLTSGAGGQVGGYREHVDFGASPTGMTFGLYTKSTGEADFALLTDPTRGADNAGPFVGPLVINEVMYHPAPPAPGGEQTEADLEFVELLNRSDSTLDLTQFYLGGGVGFTFGWLDVDSFATARWTLQAGATATWQALLPEAGDYEVLAYWDPADGEGGSYLLDSAAEYRVAHDGGTAAVTVNQNRSAAQWVSLGTYALAAGAATVTLARGTDDPDERTLADRIKFVRGPVEVEVDNADAAFTTTGGDVTALPPGGYAVIVRNADAFDERYDVAGSGIVVAGRYSGLLDNGGERIEVLRAEPAEPTGYVPWARMDSVRYDDEPPWPAEPDGTGASLCRLDAGAYGNDAGNWAAGEPGGTPGAENVVIDTTPPTAPSGLAAAAADGATRIDLTWQPATDPQSGVDHYVIYRNDAAYDTSPTTAYTDGDVPAGAAYSYQVSAVNLNGYEGDRCEAAEVTIAGLASADAPDAATLRLTFTEAMEQGPAELLANYDVTGATVLAAVLADAVTVVLTTSQLQAGQTYAVTVRNAATASSNPVPAELQASLVFVPPGSGRMLLEYWTGIAGNNVGDLTGNARYPDQPDGRDYPDILELPADDLGLEDDYGTRMRGYLHPQVTGAYVFWIASDNGSTLLLSTDDDPANAVQVAYVSGWARSREWDKYASQQSVEITLQAGQRYYVEAVQKEGGGGDNLAVGWRLPDGTLERPIPGIYLSPYALGPSVLSFEPYAGDVPSELSGVAVRFSEDVSASLDAGDLALRDAATGAIVDLAAATVQYAADTDTAWWDLAGVGVPPGHYTLTLGSAGIANAAGFALDGDGDAIPGGDREAAVTVALPGDADLDGTVDVLDYLTLKMHLPAASGATWADGDFDGDDDVDRNDFARLQAFFGKSLAPLPPAYPPLSASLPSPETTKALGDAALAAGDDGATAMPLAAAVVAESAALPELQATALPPPSAPSSGQSSAQSFGARQTNPMNAAIDEDLLCSRPRLQPWYGEPRTTASPLQRAYGMGLSLLPAEGEQPGAQAGLGRTLKRPEPLGGAPFTTAEAVAYYTAGRGTEGVEQPGFSGMDRVAAVALESTRALGSETAPVEIDTAAPDVLRACCALPVDPRAPRLIRGPLRTLR